MTSRTLSIAENGPVISERTAKHPGLIRHVTNPIKTDKICHSFTFSALACVILEGTGGLKQPFKVKHGKLYKV